MKYRVTFTSFINNVYEVETEETDEEVITDMVIDNPSKYALVDSYPLNDFDIYSFEQVHD